MQHIAKLDTTSASGKTKDLLTKVQAQMGGVPNLIATMARSPAALGGYLGLSGALAGGVLPSRLREQIAIAVAGANTCDYCASAHSLLGKKAGVPRDEIARNLAGTSNDTKTAAALAFVIKIVHERGRLDGADLGTIREAGFADEEIIEMVANVAMNIFTNYFNHIAGTEIDFPLVTTARAAA